MFSKLGVRYLVVVDERGLYKGVIEKNRYLVRSLSRLTSPFPGLDSMLSFRNLQVYLRWLEKRHHSGGSSTGKDENAHYDSEAFEQMVEEHRAGFNDRHRRLHSHASNLGQQHPETSERNV